MQPSLLAPRLVLFTDSIEMVHPRLLFRSIGILAPVTAAYIASLTSLSTSSYMKVDLACTHGCIAVSEHEHCMPSSDNLVSRHTIAA